MRALRCLSVALGVVSLILAACSKDGPDAHPPTRSCDGKDRPQLECAKEINYDTQKVSGGFQALGIQAQASTEKIALRQLGQEVEQYTHASRSLCDEYNKCVIDKDVYATRSENLRRRLAKAPELLERVQKAATPAERKIALAAAYDEMVPAERSVKLEVELGFLAERPGENGLSAVRSGAKLATGSRVAFTLKTSTAAHVYLLQKKPDGKIDVLFPDARLETKNPLPAGAQLSIPGGGRAFKVNAKDLGTEHVIIAASLKPLTALDQVATSAGTSFPLPVDATKDDSCPRGLELDVPAPTCVQARGLELEPAGDSTSLRARSEAGDGVVLKVFTFEHTP